MPRFLLLPHPGASSVEWAPDPLEHPHGGPALWMGGGVRSRACIVAGVGVY